jgi:hydrogenase maturation protease
MSTPGTLVVGLGSPHRGDDAVGIEVATAVSRAVRRLGLRGVEVVPHGDPTDLVLTWSGRDLAVVVDAVTSGAAPGTLVRVDVGPAHPGWSDGPMVGARGTHALGLAAAVELGRALDRLPGRLVVVGVEAGSVDHGTALSPPVAEAVPGATDAVLALLAASTTSQMGSC